MTKTPAGGKAGTEEENVPTALIVVDSCFGNARTVGQAVTDGLNDAGVNAQLTDVAQAPDALPEDLDLLVLGSPTHNRTLPTATTRAQAYKMAGTEAPARGMREWLAETEIPARPAVAIFDTVSSRSWLSGSAAKTIAKSLRNARSRDQLSIKSFVVSATRGPLADGEQDDARDWGQALASRAQSH